MKRFLDWATSSFQDDFTGTLSALIAALIAIIFFCLSFSVANASTTTIQVVNGGTGTSTTPSYGQLLIGGHNSEYEFISTSTLNLTTSAFASPNISQWTNNAGYLISESDPLSLHLTTWYATTSAPQLTTLGNLSTVGTITSGTWHGTAIADSYISSSGNWNTAYSDRIASANYPLSISSNALSIVATSSENCTVSCFASANISQWTNNSGYLTSTGIESTSTNPLMATYFVATGTVASNLPYASTTAWSITSTSTGSFGINLSGGCFAISGTCIGGGLAGRLLRFRNVADRLFRRDHSGDLLGRHFDFDQPDRSRSPLRDGSQDHRPSRYVVSSVLRLHHLFGLYRRRVRFSDHHDDRHALTFKRWHRRVAFGGEQHRCDEFWKHGALDPLDELHT